MVDAFRKLKEEGVISTFPVKDLLAATSVGIVTGRQASICALKRTPPPRWI